MWDSFKTFNIDVQYIPGYIFPMRNIVLHFVCVWVPAICSSVLCAYFTQNYFSSDLFLIPMTVNDRSNKIYVYTYAYN